MNQLCPEDRAILNSLFNPLLPLGEGVYTDDEPQASVVEESSDWSDEVQALNIAGVTATEQNKKEEALAAFAQAIAMEPSYPAPYNNRAQLYRLMRQEDDAMADLEKALELSGGKGTVACQASLQMGLLLRLQGHDEQATSCFKTAASLGSSFAKTQLVALNPMAALCNKMLVKMVTDVQQGVVE